MQDLLHSFPGQEKNEPVFIFVRPYWIAFLPTAFVFLFVFILSLIFQFSLANNLLVELRDASIANALLFLGLFQLLTVIVFFVAVFDFYFDIVIVTDRRMVDIDQEQLFFRRISELALEDVQDASSQVAGLFPTIFGYGTVEVQTAGTQTNFKVANIRHPNEIRTILLDLAAQAHEDVAAQKRWPEGAYVGVINNELIPDATKLKETGAITAEDLSRAPSNAA